MTTPGDERPGSPEPGSPEFLRAVRRAAGWRVSPRHVAPVLEALQQTGSPVSVERVAELVSTIHGDRSARQRRYPELWRLVGAYLALQGRPAHPEAQRAFIGRCRRLVGASVSDALLLHVAAAAGASGKPLEARTVAGAARWLLDQGVTGLDDPRFPSLVPRAFAAAERAETAATRVRTARGQSGQRTTPTRPTRASQRRNVRAPRRRPRRS